MNTGVQTLTFIDEDVRAYLASLLDDEVIGECCHPERCLLACAVQQKYPGARIAVRHDHLTMFHENSSHQQPLTPYQREVMDAFDFNLQFEAGAPITKAEFLRAWEEREVRG